MSGHHARNCYILNDQIQMLVDVGILKLRPEQKTVTANMTTCLQFAKAHRS